MNELFALLIFPGLLFVLALGAALAITLEGMPRFSEARLPRPGFESVTAILSLLLAVLGAAMLPWPISSMPALFGFNGPLACLLLIEGAFLIALLPGMLAADPLVNRAAIREAQVSVAGRVIIWIVLGTLLWRVEAWTLTNVPGQLLLVLAGLFALPAAINAGPFAADRSLTLSAAEHGLDQATSGLLRFVRHTRSAVLLAALLLAIVTPTPFRPPLGMLLWVALAVVAALVLRRLTGRQPRLTLPGVLRWCWWRALPIAAVGLIYLALVP